MLRVKKKTLGTRSRGITFLSFTVRGSEVHSELRTALAECDRMAGLSNVGRQTFFLAEPMARQAVECVVDELCGEARPVTTYALQPPAGGKALAAELWAFPAGSVSVRSRHAALALMGGLRWAFLGGLETDAGEDPYSGVHRLLRLAEQELKTCSLEFGQVVRTWYYLGDILCPTTAQTRYHKANQARNEFYEGKWPDLRFTPASTGIGMIGSAIALESLAVSDSAGARRAVWVDNPLQTHPYEYGPPGSREGNPSFSRGAAVLLPAAVVVFVSGTASIRGSDVVGAGDPELQAAVTIENIATVLSQENLAGRHSLPRGGTLADSQQFRVYVKRAQDLAAILNPKL